MLTSHVTSYYVFLINTDNLHTAVGFQVFQSNTNNSMIRVIISI